jgi:hypothetical protein
MIEANANQQVPSIPSPVRPRRRWLSVLLVVVLLGCGALIGSGLTVLVAVNRLQHALHHPEEFPAKATAMLRHKLGLSDDQAAKVEDIFRHRQAALLAIRREARPRVEAELGRVRAEVAEVLDAAQVNEWNLWFEEKRAKWLPPLPVPSSEPVGSDSGRSEITPRG